MLSFLRFPNSDQPVVACVANLAPVVRREQRIGLPEVGRWVEVLNTDATAFGGGVSVGDLTAEPIGCHDLPYSAALPLPPLSVVWPTPDDDRSAGDVYPYRRYCGQ